jgi:hypothetical protein
MFARHAGYGLPNGALDEIGVDAVIFGSVFERAA